MLFTCVANLMISISRSFDSKKITLLLEMRERRKLISSSDVIRLERLRATHLNKSIHGFVNYEAVM